MNKESKGQNEICVVGTFPPPVNGMALANLHLVNLLKDSHFSVTVFNTSPINSQSVIKKHFSRLVRFIKAWHFIIRRKDLAGVYISLSGGLGLIYDVVTVFICKLLNIKCALHHHGWAYFSRKRTMLTIIVKLSNSFAMHVVLCREMGRRLNNLYKVTRYITLSNIIFIYKNAKNYNIGQLQNTPYNIGMLSNLTREKGTEQFIKLAYMSKEKALPFKYILAGPCHDVTLLKQIYRAINEKVISWKGPLYGAEKTAFFQNIDIFVFPTSYRFEAEPLVIWEALNGGSPVISTNRGCISEQVGKAGVVLPAGDNNSDFIKEALEVLTKWTSNNKCWIYVADEATKRPETMYKSSITSWSHIIEYFSGKEV